MQWRPDAKKLVFLVGDAPPASRGDVPTYDNLAKEASRKHITINAIRCGTDTNTASTFQQIAALTNGEFSSIVQDGGVQQVATPYDDKMAELSRKIDTTSIIVGDTTVRHAYAEKMRAAEAAPAMAKADRAGYYAGAGSASRDDADLVGGVAKGTMSVDSLDEGSLPEDMKGMDKSALKAEVAKRGAERQAAQKELTDLAKKRDEYIKNNVKDGDGFDAKVKSSIDKQLK
jgi:hypothetical protein